MPSKKFTDLVPDFKKALAQGTKNIADKVTIDLKKEGPFWTGQFEQNWYIETGDVVIPPFKADETTWSDGVVYWGDRAYPEPADRVYTDAFVPPPDGLKGYTIGNIMQYRDAAMDLTDGRRQAGTRRTAEQDWFRQYYHGPMIGTVKLALDTVMKDAKFL